MSDNTRDQVRIQSHEGGRLEFLARLAQRQERDAVGKRLLGDDLEEMAKLVLVGAFAQVWKWRDQQMALAQIWPSKTP